MVFTVRLCRRKCSRCQFLNCISNSHIQNCGCDDMLCILALKQITQRKNSSLHIEAWTKWSPFVDGIFTLQWRHNGRDGVLNHQSHDCLLNHLYRRRSKKTQKLRVTGLCAGNSPVTGEFPAQMASNAENVSIWWRHYEMQFLQWKLGYFDSSFNKVCSQVSIRHKHIEARLPPFRTPHLKCIFLNENVWISLKISLEFVSMVRTDNITALLKIMTWRRPGDKLLSEPMMVSLLTHICVTRPQ